jgi:hypothetical protein
MVLIHQLSQPVSSVLMHHRGPKAKHGSGAIFVGLGDQLDDDRRLVRETALISSTMWPTAVPIENHAATWERERIGGAYLRERYDAHR